MENKKMKELLAENEALKNEVREEREKRVSYQDEAKQYESILTTIIGCGFLDIAQIVSMERNFPGVTEQAMELQKEMDTELDFGLFVAAVQYMAIGEVKEDLTDEQLEVLRDISIDANYMAWGGIQAYGGSTDILSEEAQEQFVEYVQSGAEEDKEAFLSLANGETVE